MKIRLLTSCAVVLLSLSGTAAAASPLKFSYFELDYISSELKEGKEEAEGFRATLSRNMGPRSFFLAEYDSREFNNFDQDGDPLTPPADRTVSFLNAGFGLRTNTKNVPSFAAFGAVTYERLDRADKDPGPDTKITDEGYGVQAGLRGFVADLFEVYASYKYLNFGDKSPFSPTGEKDEDYDVDIARVGFIVPVSQGLSLSLNYQNIDDGSDDGEVNEYLAGLRFNFGADGLTQRNGKKKP